MDFDNKKKESDKFIGIDVNLNNAIVTSNDRILGKELRRLRIKTKWRKYKKLSANKQQLNRYAKKLITLYPDTNFVVEDLKFKGKRKRSREFRRRNNTWAYKHLANRLEQLLKVEGLRLLKRQR